MIESLKNNPLLLLFLVAGLGYPLGRLKIKGLSLGVAAVLFVGLLVGSMDPQLRLPEVLQTFGLVLFIYTIGLANGPTFVSSLKEEGLKHNALAVTVLAIGCALVLLLQHLYALESSFIAGVFAGSLTNTPALANVVEYLNEHTQSFKSALLATDAVVAYSLTYPMGVLGPILAISLAYRYLRQPPGGDLASPSAKSIDLGVNGEHLETITVAVNRTLDPDTTFASLVHAYQWKVMPVRLLRKESSSAIICSMDTPIKMGDQISIIGHPIDLSKVSRELGQTVATRLEFDRSSLDFRRMFISDPAIAGIQIKHLNLHGRFGALITRIKRGDNEFLPTDHTVLELGDRVRVVAERERMPEITKYFGDSYKSLSEIDFMPLGFGIAIGFLLGMIVVPLPGGGEFKMGIAVGPLVAGLFFGWLERSKKIVWQLPYSANLTLRQLGLVLFLAGVGVNAGHSFIAALFSMQGILILSVGIIITFFVSLFTLLIGTTLLKIPLDVLVGTLAGIGTQPAVLAFANEKAGNDAPNSGYLMVFPFATIIKVILAQWILLL